MHISDYGFSVYFSSEKRAAPLPANIPNIPVGDSWVICWRGTPILKLFENQYSFYGTVLNPGSWGMSGPKSFFLDKGKKFETMGREAFMYGMLLVRLKSFIRPDSDFIRLFSDEIVQNCKIPEWFLTQNKLDSLIGSQV